jgi:hypothetical protein
MGRLKGIAAAVLTATAACHSGPSVQRFAPAHEPGGAAISLQLRRAGVAWRITGELLAVRDSDLLVRDTAAFWRVPIRAIRSATVQAKGGDVSIERGRIAAGSRDRLRLLSRYPHGLSDELLARLLAAYGRDSVDIAR